MASAAMIAISAASDVNAAATVPPDPPCGTVVGTAVTCTGDVTNGVAIEQNSPSFPYNKLTVNGTGNIAPGTKANGIGFLSTAGNVEVVSNPGAKTIIVDGIIETNIPARGILAHASNGYVRVVSTGNITATDGAQGMNALGSNGFYLKSKGTITADMNGITVANTGNAQSVLRNYGPVTSQNGTAILFSNRGTGDSKLYTQEALKGETFGISAVHGSATVMAGDLVVTSSGTVTAENGSGIRINASSMFGLNVPTSGTVTLTSNGAIDATGGDGIYNRVSAMRNVSLVSNAKVTSHTGNGISFRPIGTTTNTGLYIKSIAAIDAMVNGIHINNTSGDARVVSSGNINAETGDGIYAFGFHAGTPSKSIVIQSSGAVTARGFGIRARYARTLTFENAGKLTAATKDGIYGAGIDISLTNTGDGEIIAEAGRGVFFDGYNAGGSMTVVNDGTIQSKESGIHLRPREDISVEVSGAGNITSASRSGIYIEAWTANKIAINVGGEVTGAAGFAGIDVYRFDTGSGSSITIAATGHVRNAGSALDQLAIWGRGESDDAVTNLGRVTGSVDLGLGANSFDNRAGGLFVMGPKVMIGAGRKLTNAGTIAPGGDSNVLTVSVTGNVEQAAGGVWRVDVNAVTKTADLILVSGTAALAGTVIANDLGTPVTIDQEYLIMQAQGGVTPDSLLLDGNVEQTMGLAFRCSRPGEGCTDQVWLVAAEAPPPPPPPPPPDEDSELRPQPYLQVAMAGVLGAQSFSDALMGCREREGTYAYIADTQCIWLDSGGGYLDRSASGNQVGADQTAWWLGGGVQLELSETLHGGIGVRYENVNQNVGDNASNDGW